MKILKVKFSGGCLGKNLGCEKAPDLVLEGIKSEEVKVSNGNIDETMKNISKSFSLEKKTSEKKDGYDILVGGDHSISYGSFNGFSKKFKNPGIIIFDAHPDCYPEELTLFGKVLAEKKIITHENWVYCLIKEGILKKENLILIGIRAI
ncbi:MAG: arginase family protein, partial [Nanoarchaeota archaeon]